ncbi:hypothetical protein CDAR_78461 [Caerostris darwini]|uniref:Uncharacterized protein n=1 Tax=Caerostris darwini TaxID=1538125 RepID=A0AAV4WU16_9ARAC|nr:hypothetical protein CDAR_78461 [Caerostris darwini]
MHYQLKRTELDSTKVFMKEIHLKDGTVSPNPSVWERKSSKINSQINKMQCFKTTLPAQAGVWAAPHAHLSAEALLPLNITSQPILLRMEMGRLMSAANQRSHYHENGLSVQCNNITPEFQIVRTQCIPINGYAFFYPSQQYIFHLKRTGFDSRNAFMKEIHLEDGDSLCLSPNPFCVERGRAVK